MNPLPPFLVTFFFLQAFITSNAEEVTQTYTYDNDLRLESATSKDNADSVIFITTFDLDSRSNLETIFTEGPLRDFFLNPAQLGENLPAGSIAGIFTPSTKSDGFFVTLEESDSNFELEGLQLISSRIFDHESQALLTFTATASDDFGTEVSKNFVVTIGDDREEDSDGDGLSESQEEDLYGTSDQDDDSDNDGFSDPLEIQWDSDPTDLNKRLLASETLLMWGYQVSVDEATSFIPSGVSVKKVYGRPFGLIAHLSNQSVRVGGINPPQKVHLTDITQVIPAANSFVLLDNAGGIQSWPLSPPSGLENVIEVYPGGSAVAAKRRDGTVFTWGMADRGGDSTGLTDDLRSAQSIVGNAWAFAAIRSNGSVISWGMPGRGGDSASVATELLNVKSISPGGFSFAAIRDDKTVVSWGNQGQGGDSSRVVSELVNVSKVYSTENIHAAVREDGSVVAWSNSSFGSVVEGISNVIDVKVSLRNFLFKCADGSIRSMKGSFQDGEYKYGVDRIFPNAKGWASTYYAFAVIRQNGTVETWGESSIGWGVDSSGVADELYDIVEIAGSTGSFAALRSDGRVITWGTQAAADSSVASLEKYWVSKLLDAGIRSGVIAALAPSYRPIDGSFSNWVMTSGYATPAIGTPSDQDKDGIDDRVQFALNIPLGSQWKREDGQSLRPLVGETGGFSLSVPELPYEGVQIKVQHSPSPNGDWTYIALFQQSVGWISVGDQSVIIDQEPAESGRVKASISTNPNGAGFYRVVVDLPQD